MKTCLAMSLHISLTVSVLGAEKDSEIVVVTPAGTEHEMLLVPAGECQIGHGGGAGNFMPSQAVYLPDFYIDQYEVTNGRYRAFLQATGKQPPGEWGHYRQVAQPDSDQYPAIAVQWLDAVEYCQWAGLRLPTNLEWEKAARGEDSRTYPWGEGFDSTRANSGRADWDVCCFPDSADGYLYTSPVGSYPTGVSPYGACDMAGNLWEWTTDLTLGTPLTKERSIRGGGFITPWFDMSTYYITGMVEEWSWVEDYGIEIGFRCARDNHFIDTSVPSGSWGRIKQEPRK